MKIPKYVEKIHDYFDECYLNQKRCIHCYDCISFALIFAQKEKSYLPPQGVIFSTADGNENTFIKFLCSTITKEYLRCNRGITYKIAYKYSKWLLRLSKEDKEQFRKNCLCHTELQEDLCIYENSLKIYKRKVKEKIW